MDKTIVVVAGPTAVGKTEVSIALARSFTTEIISADSRQCYQEMSIGTAKPSADELNKIPHHFINSHSIKSIFSAGEYGRAVRDLLPLLFTRHDVLILTGGTGLYLNAVLEGMSDMPATDYNLRNELNKIYQSEGLEPLKEKLAILDPDYYNEVDLNNPHRIIRALEVSLATGKPFSHFRQSGDPLPYRIIKIGLELDRKILYQRINDRVDDMVEQGLFDEVSGLVDFRDHYALKTVGYQEVFRFLDGEISRTEAIDLIKRNSRRYAKRQMTWFKKDEAFVWFDPENIRGMLAIIDP